MSRRRRVDYQAAELLAAELLARRATGHAPMEGLLHDGYGRAALAHGWGWAGRWSTQSDRVAARPIPTVEGVAAWIVFCADMLDHGVREPGRAAP